MSERCYRFSYASWSLMTRRGVITMDIPMREMHQYICIYGANNNELHNWVWSSVDVGRYDSHRD